jgi:DNA-binding CsgD family transcriptional regulator
VIGSYSQHGPLTPRCADVLAGAARGETMRETAARLHISPRTVELERRVAVQRVGGRNIPNAVAIAIARGLVKPL